LPSTGGSGGKNRRDHAPGEGDVNNVGGEVVETYPQGDRRHEIDRRGKSDGAGKDGVNGKLERVSRAVVGVAGWSVQREVAAEISSGRKEATCPHPGDTADGRRF
jgi:hypothetical protein